MGNKNAHIQPLFFGELFLFSPMEQFEYQRRKKQKAVNTCHSLSACLSGDWCMPVSRCFSLFPLVACFLRASLGQLSL